MEWSNIDIYHTIENEFELILTLSTCTCTGINYFEKYQILNNPKQINFTALKAFE